MLPPAVYNRNCSIPICHLRVPRSSMENEPGVLFTSKTHKALDVIVAEF